MSVSARADQVIWVEVPIEHSKSVFKDTKKGHQHFYRLPLDTDEAVNLYNQLYTALFT